MTQLTANHEITFCPWRIQLASAWLFSLGLTICFQANVSGQVPGICVQGDGSPWATPEMVMVPQSVPNAPGPSALKNPSSTRSNEANIQTDMAQLRAYLTSNNRQKQPPQAPPKVNRYAPHSVTTPPAANSVGATPGGLGTRSTIPVQVPSANGPNQSYSPISHRQSLAFMPHARDGTSTAADDDLLTPVQPLPPFPNASNTDKDSSNRAKADEDSLLAPIPSPSPNTNSAIVPTPSLNPADPLSMMGPDSTQEKQRSERREAAPSNIQAAIDPHWEAFANERYPSALTCAKCHQKIYDEWRVSGHAYASVSPMFQRFEQAVAELTRGTSGTFCVRCHAPVATQLDYPREAPLAHGPAVFREGITCVACHRVVERYGRVNGERRIEPGSPYDPVVGNIGGDGIAKAIADADNYKVKIDPNDKRPLQGIHQGAIKFEQLSDSSFCAGCHQVLVQPGIALEIVYQQYRSGPACKKGVSCQDCHMGAVPGKPNGYEIGAAAEISGKTVNTQRKHSNHIFHGPSYPLAHPGIFPHNEKSLRWTLEQWLQFDHRQGWGTEAFEAAIARGQLLATFPPAWSLAQERRDARKVIDENEKLLAVKRNSATQVLENGSRIDGPFFDSEARVGRDIKVRYVVSNTSEGHNMPSGSLGAQPQLWLNAVLIGPDGSHLWESGHLDTNGDLCDWHSLDVRAGRFQRDKQLVNFQTKFLITNVKGTEREMYLPVNVDADPLPFFRPGAVPYTVLNHPPFIRMEAHSIPPLDSRTAHYTIPGELLCQPGVYRLSVRLRSRVEPPYFMIFCKGTPEMLQSLNESIYDVHPYSTEFVVR